MRVYAVYAFWNCEDTSGEDQHGPLRKDDSQSTCFGLNKVQCPTRDSDADVSCCVLCRYAIRGKGANWLYVDEAAAMKQDIFEKGILPLTIMNGTPVVMTSSIQSQSNWFSQLGERTGDTGAKLFHTIQYKRVCDSCEKTATAMTCPHMAHMTPRFHNAKKYQEAAAAMGNKMTAGQELMSIMGSCERAVFDPPWIKAAMKPDTAPFEFGQYDDRPIWLSCDPNGAHNQSRKVDDESLSAMALLSCVYSYEGPIRHQHILSVEAFPVENKTQIEALLSAHIAGLRAMKNFNNRRICVIIEDMLGHTGTFIADIIARLYRNVQFIQRTSDGRVGVVHAASTKNELIFIAATYLREMRVHVPPNVTSYNPHMASHTRTFDTMSKFESELFTFQEEKRKNRTDMVMAWMMNIFWSQVSPARVRLVRWMSDTSEFAHV